MHSETEVSIEHGSPLPADIVSRVPPTEKLVLNFVLSFLEAERLPAQLLVNGGYVRDLLLGKHPDDLDLSLCLRDCDTAVTIDSVMAGLATFASARPDLNVSSVNVTTILSDTSKDKNVDTAKAYLLVGTPPDKIEVDFMPTIGEEQYDEHDRVPLRDVRGTAEQDALRRDLTIGAMMLQISRAEPVSPPAAPAGLPPAPADTSTAALAQADLLQWTLLDFYGGLADLRTRTLRSPYPAGRQLAEVWDEVLRTPEDKRIADRLGLRSTPATTFAGPVLENGERPSPAPPLPVVPPSDGGTAPSLPPSPGASALERADVAAAAAHNELTLQVVWWVKVLRDDPLRVLRALRFAAKLGFRLHDTFWLAVPFSLLSLQTKVAGSRKGTELLKIAKAGRQPLVAFMELSFGRQIADASEMGAEDGGTTSLSSLPLATLAPALFGGADHKGEASFLGTPHGFDPALLRRAVEALPEDISEEEGLGSGLAAAMLACRLPWGGERAVAAATAAAFEASSEAADEAADESAGEVEVPPATPISEVTVDAASAATDAAAAAAAEAATVEATVACDGLCASNDFRAAAVTPLACVGTLLQPKRPLGMHALFAEAAALDAVGTAEAAAPAAGPALQAAVAAPSATEFAALVSMWDTLKLEKVLQGRAPAGYLPSFVVQLASTRCSATTAVALEARLARLATDGVSINGKALVGVSRLPNHLRGVLISHLHVLARLRGEQLELHEPAQLVAYLESGCGGLLAKLHDEWYEEGGGDTLRAAYAPPGKQAKSKLGKPAKQPKDAKRERAA